MELITSCMAAGYRGIIFDRLTKLPVIQSREAAGAQGIPETNNPFASAAFGGGEGQ